MESLRFCVNKSRYFRLSYLLCINFAISTVTDSAVKSEIPFGSISLKKKFPKFVGILAAQSS
ncbi:hypothetical protein [Iningainema tapete]|uniref:hypothetical protein n=1 Tax=Iningainema tapete TaxID=2806730 RepID=UPI003B589044